MNLNCNICSLLVILICFSGLTSLKAILPELRVIRGNDLIMNYALVVYQNSDLVYLGLNKLVEISNGGVRIADNAVLCLAEDINWATIVKGKINDTLVTTTQMGNNY